MTVTDDPIALLSFAHDLLDETDALALRHVAGGLTVSAKPDRTLVTQADTEIETHLRDRIANAFPTHTIAGEEFGTAADAGDGRWIMDPIDATHNVVRGIEVFATLLAFEREGELLLGVVSAPAMHRRWWATRGGGATVRSTVSTGRSGSPRSTRSRTPRLPSRRCEGSTPRGWAKGCDA